MLGKFRHHCTISTTLLACQVFEKDEHVRLLTFVHDLLDPIIVSESEHGARIVFFVLVLSLCLPGHQCNQKWYDYKHYCCCSSKPHRLSKIL